VVARRRDDVGKRLEKLDFVQPQVKDLKPPVRPTLPDAPAPVTPSGNQRSPGDLTDDPVR
jgi:hypothetical protein